MSITAMAYVWQHSVLRGTELVLLLAIADFANEHGIAWPGVETLAGRIRADVRTTQRCIAKVEKSQELRIQRGRGPKGTHLYQVIMQANLPLFAEQQERPGGVASRPPGKTPPRQTATKRGGKAMPPEPSGTIIKKKVPGQPEGSPVTLAWKVYHHAMLARYQASPAQDAKSNGIIAKLVKAHGLELAELIIGAYVADGREYYVNRRHPLEVLAKDAHRIAIDLKQRAAGGPAGPAPRVAVAYLEHADQEAPTRMTEYPVADPLDVAKAFAKDYASKVNRQGVTNVLIRIGGRETRFKPEELR